MTRIGQRQEYTVCMQQFLQGIHQMYGRIRRIYTVLANPAYEARAFHVWKGTPVAKGKYENLDTNARGKIIAYT